MAKGGVSGIGVPAAQVVAESGRDGQAQSFDQSEGTRSGSRRFPQGGEVPPGHERYVGDDAGVRRPGRWLPAIAVALPAMAMAAIGGIGLTGSGLWPDELATWWAATTSVDNDLGVLRYVDGVFGPYYAVMKVWVAVFGDTDVALRLSSLLAMVVAAGLIGAIGRRLVGVRTGVIAGLLFAVLPGTSRFGQEVRPYAMVTCAAILATYLLVRLMERPSRPRYCRYAVALAATGLLHMVAVLILVPHVVMVLTAGRSIRRNWLIASVAGVLPVLPFVWIGASQSGQVAWIATTNQAPQLYATTLFGGFAALAVMVLIAIFARPYRYPGTWFVAWALGPVLALLAISVVMPLMQPRYLLFCLPGWALLIGSALSGELRPGATNPAGTRPARSPRAVLRWAVAVGLVLAIGLLGLQRQREVRQYWGHEGIAARELAEVIGAQYQPSDAILYAVRDQDTACCSWAGRSAIEHYLPAGRRPTDVFMPNPPYGISEILPVPECQDAVTCLGAPPRLWIVRLADRPDPVTGLGEPKESLVKARYQQVRQWRIPGFTVALMVTR